MATATLIGYAYGSETMTSWNGPVSMATNTATCFIVTGGSLLMLGIRHAKLRKQSGGDAQ